MEILFLIGIDFGFSLVLTFTFHPISLCNIPQFLNDIILQDDPSLVGKTTADTSIHCRIAFW